MDYRWVGKEVGRLESMHETQVKTLLMGRQDCCILVWEVGWCPQDNLSSPTTGRQRCCILEWEAGWAQSKFKNHRQVGKGVGFRGKGGGWR